MLNDFAHPIVNFLHLLIVVIDKYLSTNNKELSFIDLDSLLAGQ